MSNREMTYEEAYDFAMDHYLAGNIEYMPNMRTDAAELQAALVRWDIKVTTEPWPNTKKGLVTIDGDPAFEAFYNPAVRWNGWLCPTFTREVAEKVVAWVNEEPGDNVFTWAGDVLIHDQTNYPDDPAERIEPDDLGRYAIGAFSWVWSAADDED